MLESGRSIKYTHELYYAVQYCTALYCSVLFSTVLYFKLICDVSSIGGVADLHLADT